MENFNFERLLKNIIDVTKEMQVKLGESGEAVKLYYPKAAIERLLGTGETDIQKLKSIAAKFCDYAKSAYGEITFSTDVADRFCFSVGKNAVEKALKELDNCGFLREFISYMTGFKHGDIDEILSIFKKYSNKVVCKKIADNPDFNYLVFFEDGVPDEFYYCLEVDDFFTHYHRFTKEDYEAFDFEY
ncbi:MAG: DUF3877 family protein [Clostridia bacterium]|nr:DUF3877 family protein [Clostridia bacterium]